MCAPVFMVCFLPQISTYNTYNAGINMLYQIQIVLSHASNVELFPFFVHANVAKGFSHTNSHDVISILSPVVTIYVKRFEVFSLCFHSEEPEI